MLATKSFFGTRTASGSTHRIVPLRERESTHRLVTLITTNRITAQISSFPDGGRASAAKMRIVDLQVHSIAIADPPLRSSYGLHAPYALRTLLELKSEDGITGISETHGGDAIAQAFDQLREQIVGTDAYRLAGNLLPMIDASAPGDRSQTYHVP